MVRQKWVGRNRSTKKNPKILMKNKSKWQKTGWLKAVRHTAQNKQVRRWGEDQAFLERLVTRTRGASVAGGKWRSRPAMPPASHWNQDTTEGGLELNGSKYKTQSSLKKKKKKFEISCLLSRTWCISVKWTCWGQDPRLSSRGPSLLSLPESGWYFTSKPANRRKIKTHTLY